jgi:hypothetical protein
MLFSNIAFWVILFYFSAPSLPGWATKNWLPTLFSESLNMDGKSRAFVDYDIGNGVVSRCVGRRIYVRPLGGEAVKRTDLYRVIGLGLTIPALY